MEKQKEKWINEVLKSTEGSQRALPNPKLFSKIEAELNQKEAKRIQLDWRKWAAAMVLLIMVNIYCVRKYTQSSDEGSVSMDMEHNENLISDYNLYE